MQEVKIFPVYTTVEANPFTILKVMENAVFQYPFFNEGVTHCKKVETDFRVYSLDDIGNGIELNVLPVRGLIFHTSHCGSTLLSRMLGILPGVRVVSETEAINGLLLSYLLYQLPEAEVMLHLKKIINAYRQPFSGDCSLIFKLSSWNVFFIHFFQRLFPGVPWIFIDRNQDEIIRSLVKLGGGFADWWHYPADIIWRSFLGPDELVTTKEEYLVKMVQMHRFCAIQNNHNSGCFLQYPQFIEQFSGVILPHLQLQFTEEEIRPALEMTRFQAKILEKVPFAGTG